MIKEKTKLSMEEYFNIVGKLLVNITLIFLCGAFNDKPYNFVFYIITSISLVLDFLNPLWTYRNELIK